MPRVSRVRLQQKQLEDFSSTFSSLLASLHHTSDVKNFLYEFLTKEEKIMLSKRLMLLLMLSQGYTPPTIQGTLGLSYETVRSYQHFYHMKSGFFIATLRQLSRKKDITKFFIKLENLLITVAKAKTNMKSRSKFFSGLWN